MYVAYTRLILQKIPLCMIRRSRAESDPDTNTRGRAEAERAAIVDVGDPGIRRWASRGPAADINH